MIPTGIDFVGLQIMQTLTRLGFAYKLNNGDMSNVRFSERYYTENGKYFLFELDTVNVPYKVRVTDCLAPKVIHELSTTLGKRVFVLNTTRATIAVLMEDDGKKLPKMVEFEVAKGRPPYSIPLGISRAGPQYAQLDWTSHILVGGESRSGKSTWLNSMLLQLIHTHTPEELAIYIADPKGVEFIQYGGIPHLQGMAIAVSPEESISLTAYLCGEMDKRQVLFQQTISKKLSQYNQKVDVDKQLPLIVYVIDEITDLSIQAGDAFTDNLIRLASKGASFGIILVLATQHPRFDILSTLVKGNMSTRIAFRVNTVDHSRTILGVGGAQRIPSRRRGRCMVRFDADLIEMQGLFCPEEKITQMLDELRGSKTLTYTPQKAFSLKPIEIEMIRWAVYENNGRFTLAKLIVEFTGAISKSEIEKVSQYWNALGFLKKEGRANVITRALQAIAGV